MKQVRTLLALAAAGTLLCSTQSMAQHPRMVVIEEATNASCPPCAAQNPTFEKYLAGAVVTDNVIPIIYHAWWPGSDVMYTAEPTLPRHRLPYYGIGGVPMAVVGGLFTLQPIDTAAIASVVERQGEQPTPVAISLGAMPSGDSVSVSVEVTSDIQLAATLNVIVVEKHHYYANAGNNGEKDFHYIARRGLPSATGTALSLAPGTPQNFAFSFAMDPAWNREEIHVVAFVQNNVTKEILQGATTRPGSPVTLLNAQSRSSVQSGIGAESYDATLKARETGDFTVMIASDLPEGWNTRLTIDGEPVSGGETVGLVAGSQAAMQVTIDPAGSTDLRRSGSVSVSIVGDSGVVAASTYRLYANDIEALVIQRHEGAQPNIPVYFDQALRNGSYRYALVRPADEDLFDLSKHVVVYEVGKYALTRQDIADLKELIEGGGSRLFMIGAEIGYGLADPSNTDQNTPRDLAFMRDYLHATYVRDDNPATNVSGVAGDPVGDGLSFSITSGVKNQDTPDEIAPTAGALPSFTYGSSPSQVAGIRYADDRQRLIFLGFGAEGIGDLQARTDLLKKGIEWLMGSERTVSVDRPALTLGTLELRPNPARDQVTIMVPGKGERVSIELVDARGGIALRQTRSVGSDRSLVIDLEGLPAGVYTVIVDGGGERGASRLVITR